jgi:xylulokinase
MGERSPRWNSYARGGFIGLKAEHTRKDLLRSVVEGVTFNLALILNIFKEYENFDEILLIGGGAKSDVWMQIISDCWGINVIKPNYIEEASSMGAAVAGGVGIGLYESFSAIDRFIEVEKVIVPNMKNYARYVKSVDLFDRVYYALEKLFIKFT